MKKTVYRKSNLSLLFLIILIAIGFNSCDKMDDNYKSYLEDGEILYIPKPLNLTGKTGNQRIQLEWNVSSNVKIDNWVVSYDDVIVKIPNENSKSTSKQYVIDGVDEGNYIFSVWSESENGNASIKDNIVLTVFGESYRESLTPREINALYIVGVKAKVVFKSSASLGKHTEVMYYDVNGTELTEVLDKDDFEVELLNIDFNEEIKYRTFYVPTPAIEDEDDDTILIETSIDEFASNWEVMEIEPSPAPNIDRNGWAAIEESSIAFDGWNIERMWDGDMDSAWHTPWDGTNYPHYFVIDIGEVKAITGFEIARKWDWRVPIKTKFEVSLDYITWVDLGNFYNPNPDSDAPQSFNFLTYSNARYFRVTFLEGTGSEAVIREFNVQGI